MEKLPMCRICLVENVRMHVVVDKNMHELYETLTNVPFVTEDSKPIHACFFCYAKLKQCCQLQRKCLDAEKFFTQIINEETTLSNRGHLEFSNGLTKGRIESIDIVDVSEMESIAVKEEFTTNCESHVFEPKEELQDLKQENVEIEYSDADDTTLHHSESDEDNVPLIEFKTELEEEQEVLVKKRRAGDTGITMEGQDQMEMSFSGNSEMEGLELCIVCGDRASGRHYGVISCEGCKGFFKRSIRKKLVYKCRGRMNCKVTKRHRKRCQYCRLQKCFACGMRSDSVQDERKPIADKSKCEQREGMHDRQAAYSKFLEPAGQEVYSQINRKEEPSDAFGAVSPVINFALAAAVAFNDGYPELELNNVDNSHAVVKDTPAYDSESDSEDDEPVIAIKTEVEDEQESMGALIVKKTNHESRKAKPEDTITAVQKKNSRQLIFTSKIVQKTQNRMSKLLTEFEEPIATSKQNVNRIYETPLVTNKRNNCNKNEISVKTSNKGSDDINGYVRECVKEKRFKCDICQSSFKLRYKLTIHMRTHTGEKPYKCHVCQRSFCKNDVLTRHVRTHTGEKPFKCDICQRCFSENSTLTKHIRTHTGEKPYKCDICQRSFSETSKLKCHIRVHTAEKPFKCRICQRCFSENSTLTKHIRTHTGEKPYKCDICQRSFRQSSGLNYHIRVHAGK